MSPPRQYQTSEELASNIGHAVNILSFSRILLQARGALNLLSYNSLLIRIVIVSGSIRDTTGNLNKFVIDLPLLSSKLQFHSDLMAGTEEEGECKRIRVGRPTTGYSKAKWEALVIISHHGLILGRVKVTFSIAAIVSSRAVLSNHFLPRRASIVFFDSIVSAAIFRLSVKIN